MSKADAKKKLAEETFAGEVKGHEHIHAANCGHKSYVHGSHIDYEHDGHFHYYLNGRTFECEGPFAGKKDGKVLPFKKK